MATAVSQPQRYDITVSGIVNVHGTGSRAVPAGLAGLLNTLWEGQITTAQCLRPEDVYETYRFNPLNREVREGFTDRPWTFTTRAWAPIMAELLGREAKFVFAMTYNASTASGQNRGVSSTYTKYNAGAITGYPEFDLPEVGSDRASSSNVTTVTIRPKVFEIFGANGNVVIERDIPGHKLVYHGVDLLAGARASAQALIGT